MTRTQKVKQKLTIQEKLLQLPAHILKPRVCFLLVVVALLLFGLVMIYSSSSILALTSEDYGNNAQYFLNKQLIATSISFVLFLVCALIPFRFLVDYKTLLVTGVISTVLLVVTRFLGTETLGATRWINVPGLGQFQPAEFVKIQIILCVAYLLDRVMNHSKGESLKDVKLLGAISLLNLVLIFFQPDKGTTLLVFICAVYLLGVAQIVPKTVFYWGLLGFVVLGLGYLAVSYFLDASYAAIRIKAWLFPEAYKDFESYQIMQGYYAFGSGGMFGKGIGYSAQKFGYLPMAYNDYIFPIIGEECGLVGTILVTLAFFSIFMFTEQIAKQSHDSLGTFVCLGCGLLLVVQFLINVVGVVGLLPASGKPIPFLSYGGSSIMATAIMVGLIINVSRLIQVSSDRYEKRRAQLTVMDSETANASANFRVLNKKDSSFVSSFRRGPKQLPSANGLVRERIDSHPSARERFRSR